MRRLFALIVAAALALARGGDALSEGVTATDRSIASGRDTIIEGDVYQGASQAEVEGIVPADGKRAGPRDLVQAAARGATIEASAKIRELGEQLDLAQRGHGNARHPWP